jgi:hypothetical protein
MWFEFNTYRFALELIPNRWRDMVTVSFAMALVKPIESLYNTWYNYRQNNLYILEHTGQVCSLRKSLNDKFDPSERRIYIADAEQFAAVVLYTEAEAIEVPIYTEAEGIPLVLYTEAEMDSDLDYIVYVPASVYVTQMPALKAHINIYNMAGLRYAIFIIP